MTVFSNIICCLNLSENPDDVVQYVNDIVLQNGAQLILVHVSADSSFLRRSSHADSLERLVDKSRQQNQAAFEEYAKKHFQKKPLIVWTEGRVDKELLKLIDKHCADLLIVGSSSIKGWFGSVLNSAVEQLIGKTRIPVVIIPNELSLECSPDF